MASPLGGANDQETDHPYNDDVIDLMENLWPWGKEWWKPSDRRRDLVKAGALIAAEIDRLDRAKSKP